MPVLGITGGVGTGKSTFTRIFAGITGSNRFDADACARRLTDMEPGVRGEIGAAFGSHIFAADGSPDRALLRRLILTDADARRTLENILHPRIRRSWLEQSMPYRTGTRLFLVEIPLLFETGAEREMDRVVVVAADRRSQMQRLTSLRGLSVGEAEKLCSIQMSLTEKTQKADHVIWNDGSLESLEAQAALLARTLAEPIQN